METKKCKDCWKILELKYFYKKWIAYWKQQYQTRCKRCAKDKYKELREPDQIYYRWRLCNTISSQILKDRESSKKHYYKKKEERLEKMRLKRASLSPEEKKLKIEKWNLARKKRRYKELLNEIKEKRLNN